MRVKPLAVLFACSCAASAGRLANELAVTLDGLGAAQMVPVAALGAGMAQALNTARSRFPVVALDGCAVACARRCLEQQGVEPAAHYVLSEFGIEKRDRGDFTPAEAKTAFDALSAALA